LEGLKKMQEEQYPVFKPAILSGFQIAAHKNSIYSQIKGALARKTPEIGLGAMPTALANSDQAVKRLKTSVHSVPCSIS